MFTTFISCNETSHKTDNKSRYSKVIDSAYRLYYGGKSEECIGYLNAAITRYSDLTTRQKYDYGTLKFGHFFHTKKDINRALLYTDSILAVFDTPEKKLQYAAEYSQSLFYKGDVLFTRNKYNEAYQYFYQGKLMAKTGTNKCNMGDFSYRMGMILYKQEHYKLAADNFRNAWIESGQCPVNFLNFYRRQELLNNTGLSYSKINVADSALVYLKKALDFIDDNSVKYQKHKPMLDAARGVVYGNLAKIYILHKNYPIAKKLLKRSIDINLSKGGDNRDAELSELKLVHLYYQENQLDSMVSLLNTVRTQLDTVKNQDAEVDWNLMMANYFTGRSNPKPALAYIVRYNALRDSAIAGGKALKDADINQQIQRLEKDYQVNAMKKDIQLRDSYLKFSAVIGLMLVTIVFLVLLNWRKSGKNIKMLGNLNKQINDQNAELEHALTGLKISSQEKDRILRTVAHDLRNPIGGIASLTMVMEDDDYSTEQKAMIGLIKDTSKNALELINEILEATNSGAVVLKKEIVDINNLMNNTVELLHFKAAEKGQKIILELLETALELNINREKIWRVTGNIIVNAIKFSPPGATIAVKLVDFDNEVEISIRDNGIGIPENLKDKVFNMFTEAKRPGTSGEKSFGLGLSISKQIVESHGGRIWFESINGQGTTFFMRLPKQ